jgi:hypothetical protein
MKSIHQKHEILESLDALDQVQAEKVLTYIKALLVNQIEQDSREQRAKREAMMQIRQALGATRSPLSPNF